jgi:hypothetical protein
MWGDIDLPPPFVTDELLPQQPEEGDYSQDKTSIYRTQRLHNMMQYLPADTAFPLVWWASTSCGHSPFSLSTTDIEFIAQ